MAATQAIPRAGAASPPANRAAGLVGVPRRLAVATVVEVELSLPLPDLADTGADEHVLVVALLCGRPLGMALLARTEVAGPATLAAAIERELGDAIAEHAAEHGLDAAVALTADGVAHDRCPVTRDRERLARTGPGVSVIVCTRDRPGALARCLASIVDSDYNLFEVVVVDNAPKTPVTELVCARLRSEGAPITYLREERPGLSWARNTGIVAAEHDLIAFVDDDERVDAGWLPALVQEFEADGAVGCVSGVVLPAELRTPAQVEFEQFGGHSKGRGFQRVVFDRDYLVERQSAMYPLPPFGVGANMAFRRAALEQIGGFDVALGAGTPTHGAEDTYAFTELLLGGWTMVYAPAAITWHYHRADPDALASQLAGYGVGLGAYYTALVARNPARLAALVRLAPRALRDLRDPTSARNTSLGELPSEIAGANLRGILKGPLQYARARRRARRQLRDRPKGRR